ncbi:MAG: 23S rRNA (adenine(2503)-C(2))-methyltransferase RlmN [Chloroflexi bacterium]|nr:23S rRNA (adenine(2503)-C(2))-methyltransferase RlmN [Chloroflexota bacterium]
MPSLFDLSFEQLAALLSEWGQPLYRAKQVWGWAYTRLAPSFAAMTDLPKALRELLEGQLQFSALAPALNLRSRDNSTHKILFRLRDGYQIETVLMRYRNRRTLCISTQAGCVMGCVFCATGQMGFDRHLSAGEIVEQVLWFARQLKNENDALTNIVIMGMGEPFHNYDAALAAVDRLTDPEAFNFGARRLTLSTVGLIPMIERFANEKRQVNLAVSLHAATNDLRNELIPINRKYPLDILMPACRDYVAKTGRRISFEWALIHGKNDMPEQARALARLLTRPTKLLSHVNLIPLNPTRDFAGAASTRERVADFKAILDAHGIPCTVRVRRGIDINAGCGQLRAAAQESVSAPPTQSN